MTITRESVRSVIAEAAKPLYAAVGAGDLAIERLAHLSSATVRSAVESYRRQARSEFERLTQRGEDVVARVRQSAQPRSADAGFDETLGAVDEPAPAHKASGSSRRGGRASTGRKAAPRRKAD